ncbi:MAG: hypothetical protein ABL908_22840, partial [Hyphomicrobium sp.]
MATFSKLPSGQWRVQIRRKKLFLSRSFRIKALAEQWAREQEQLIDKGLAPTESSPDSRETLASLIDLHFADLKELKRGIGRSKEHTLYRLRETIGATRLSQITRESLVDFAKRRAKEGAGPVTISIDLSFIGTVLEHASAVHGVVVQSGGHIAVDSMPGRGTTFRLSFPVARGHPAPAGPAAHRRRRCVRGRHPPDRIFAGNRRRSGNQTWNSLAAH